MTAMKRAAAAVANIVNMREPNPSLPALQDQIEQDLADYIPRYNDPEVSAADVGSAIDRHLSITTVELRKMKDNLRSRYETLDDILNGLLGDVDRKMAEAGALVRDETAWINRKIDALKSE